MLSSEEILENAARDGSLDIAEWPRVLESLLKRLHDIVHNDFPTPSLPHVASQPPHIDPQVVASTPPRLLTGDNHARERGNNTNGLSDSQNSAKENEDPADVAAGRAPPAATRPVHDASDSQRTEVEDESAAQGDSVQPPPGTLPPDLLSLYQTSRRILEYDFPESPPYTLQRLAELVLRPKAHYRYLPAYLRALDRIVSVSSPISNFPLPTMQSATNPNFLTNGTPTTNGVTERDTLGSDESLGGALLTPIPWLREGGNVLAASITAPGGELHSENTEIAEGPHGVGSIETVSVTMNGITSNTNASAYTNSSPIASPTLSEQSDASSSSESSMEAQLREQGAVTQGELLRQEQEAGVVPVGPADAAITPRRALISGGAAAVGRDAPMEMRPAETQSMDDEQPYARGPGVIGMEDMGPQRQDVESGHAVLDMEAAVGRGRSKSPQPPLTDEFPKAKQENMEGVEPGTPGFDAKDVEKDVAKLRETMDPAQKAEAKDSDGDVVLADVDGKPIDEKPATGGEADSEEAIELKAK